MDRRKPRTKEGGSVETPEITSIWEEHPDYIRKFLLQRPQYEQLCKEVAYILENRLRGAQIEYATITSRAKTLASFAEKIVRKNYQDPFSEITDIAGVRIVFLYKNDFPEIENIIKSEFKIFEKINTAEKQSDDKFGYGAVHFLVKLGKKSAGARYDDLKDLTCEIQVRTIVQDAWAILAHHLVYKKEPHIPKHLQRKLNSLSGLFETADDQFDTIRHDREEYLKSIKSIRGNKDQFLNQEINLDTFIAFLKWRFPGKAIANPSFSEIQIVSILSWINESGYSRLSELEKAVAETKTALSAYLEEEPVAYAADLMHLALCLQNSEYARVASPRSARQELINKYKHLVKT